MKNLFALILVGSLLLAGCGEKKATNDQTVKDVAPVGADQKAPVVTDEATTTEPSGTAIAQVQEPAVKRAADKIFFDFDSCLLTPVSQKALEGNALWLQAQPEVRIVIEGYADERGSDEYNLALGDKRAQAARDYLVKIGIAPERIAVTSYGEEKATKGAASEAVWAQDRRAEFVTTN